MLNAVLAAKWQREVALGDVLVEVFNGEGGEPGHIGYCEVVPMPDSVREDFHIDDIERFESEGAENFRVLQDLHGGANDQMLAPVWSLEAKLTSTEVERLRAAGWPENVNTFLNVIRDAKVGPSREPHV
jgi:hypothetical protein